MKKVLFICLGNVARSQMAEGFYNYFTGSNDAISAGIIAYTPKKYVNPIREVIICMNEEEIDVSKKIVKTINHKMIIESEKIFVLCKKDECSELLLEQKNLVFWKIKDPYQTSIDNYRMIRNQIKKKVLALIESL